MESLGKFIKQEIEKRNWTQTEFGAMIGINTCAICRIENGSQKFSLCKLEKLSEIFEVDLQQIKNIFFAEKFAKEAYQNNCSNAVFIVAMRIIENIDNSILNKKTI